MKTLLLLAISFTIGHAAYAEEACLRCAEIDKLLTRMQNTPADPANERTSDAQDQILDTASGIIYSLMNKKQLNLATSRALINLTAKAIGYSNDGLIGADNSRTFRRHWANPDGAFKTATDELVHSGKITEAEKTAMLVEMGVIVQPAPKRRR